MDHNQKEALEPCSVFEYGRVPLEVGDRSGRYDGRFGTINLERFDASFMGPPVITR